MSKKRKEVTKSIEDAVALIKDGQTVAIGGFGADNHPMAIVREMIRTGKKNLTIVASATAGLEIDLLIGAGCVKKLIAPYVGQEMYCPIGHNYRKYAESGQIEIAETSEYLLYAGFFAAASGQEFFAWRGGVGTSIPKLNKDLVEFMSSGKSVVMALEAENAIAKWRDTMGATDPAKAAPGTIRKELGTSIQYNCTHGSDAPETAAVEIAYFFSGSEIG